MALDLAILEESKSRRDINIVFKFLIGSNDLDVECFSKTGRDQSAREQGRKLSKRRTKKMLGNTSTEME